MHTDTLAQGAPGPLLYCPRVAVGAKGIGVLQIWKPNPFGAHKFLGLTETNYSLPSASS